MIEFSEGKSALIGIRHGHTSYANSGHDLTPRGIEEVRSSASILKAELEKYDHIFVVSSPMPRALATAKEFLQQAEIPEAIRISDMARSVDVKNADFSLWNNLKSQDNHGENYWILHPSFQDRTVDKDGTLLIEGRKAVEKRTIKLLDRYGKFVKKLEESTGQSIAMLIFTHAELIIPLMRGIYPGESDFPVDRERMPHHAEYVIIKLDDPDNWNYTIYARGEKSRVTYSPEKHLYIARK